MFRSLISSALLGLSIPVMLAGSEAVSEPVGFTRQTIKEGRQTVGVTLNNPTILSATVAANSSDALMLASTGRSIGAMLEPGASYYVEVVAGGDQLYVGDRFDIDVDMTRAIGGEIIALRESANNSSALQLGEDQLTGYRINIRRHVTLADVFGSGHEAVLQGSADFATADQVFLFDRERGDFETYFLHEDSTTGEVTWRQLGRAGNVDAKVIAPGTGMFVKRVGQGSVELVHLGTVRTNDFIMPLAGGYNLVASPYPVEGTPAALQMNSANGFASASTAESADRILVFNGTDYDTYYLHATADSAGETWRKVGDETQSYSTTELLSAFNSVFIFKVEADPYFIARRS